MIKNTVSIIMGVYNSENSLDRAIKSIINQSFKDWIFIICDDGSNDSSLDILKRYQVLYPDKFIILNNPINKGLTYSLNYCLQYSDSTYIARMDSDDVSLPKRLETEVAFLDSHPEYAFVGTSIERFDENGVWSSSIATNPEGVKKFLRSSGYVHPSVMIRRDALLAVDGYRDTWFTKRCEDYDLWMRLYSNGYYGYNLKDILFQYYEGRESFPKRKYRYRLCEFITRVNGYHLVGVKPVQYLYAFKPLIVGLVPDKLMLRIHTWK